ncbi:MAG: hypothetical protein NVS9B6_08900 [Candidatus Limnocylindrales bacterium]
MVDTNGGGAGLGAALASVERRFGTQVLARGARTEQRGAQGRLHTLTALDRITDGIAAGAPVAFVGPGTAGKVTLALRVAAAAQRDGGTVLWIDGAASFDPLAASVAGVLLDRLIIVRPHGREDALLAASAALRSDGFRLTVVDTGPAISPAPLRADDLAPLLPIVRGSAAALVVIAEQRAAGLALPAITFERVAWETRFGRTSGWVVSAAAGHGTERALFRSDLDGAIGATGIPADRGDDLGVAGRKTG